MEVDGVFGFVSGVRAFVMYANNFYMRVTEFIFKW